MSYFDDVIKFHRQILNVESTAPHLLDTAMFYERMDFLNEELQEFAEANWSENIVGAADALADIVYVALGTAYLMGLPFDAIWAAVQHANMSKVRGMTTRGNAVDAAKPEGWVGPEGAIAKVIHNAS